MIEGIQVRTCITYVLVLVPLNRIKLDKTYKAHYLLWIDAFWLDCDTGGCVCGIFGM